MSQATGISSGNGNTAGSVYTAAHAVATPQIGNIYRTVYDAAGRIVEKPYTDGVRAEYTVQPTGKPSSIIMTFP